MSGKILLINEHMFVYLKESLIRNKLERNPTALVVG